MGSNIPASHLSQVIDRELRVFYGLSFPIPGGGRAVGGTEPHTTLCDRWVQCVTARLKATQTGGARLPRARE